MNDETRLTVMQEKRLSTSEMVEQVQAVQEMMGSVMKEGINGHYGKIPGCGDKPTLLKSGAEKLCTLFRLAPSYKITRLDYENFHREYEITCRLNHIESEKLWGEGVGTCSTMEDKYRFRKGQAILTTVEVPKEYWKERKAGGDSMAILRGEMAEDFEDADNMFFGTKKDDMTGTWFISLPAPDKVEHSNPPDNYNTVLKMAKKRALVDAVLTATSASDIFTQDLEDLGKGVIVEVTATTTKKENPKFITIEEANSIKESIEASGCFEEFKIFMKTNKVDRITEIPADKYNLFTTAVNNFANKGGA